MGAQLDPSVLQLLSYGLYVVTSKSGKKVNGQIVNTVFQVTAKPPRVAVSINKENLTHEYITRSRIFSVSILDESTPMQFIGLFGFKSGHDMDKLTDVTLIRSANDCPIVTDHSVGILEVKVIDQVDVGTHTVFIGDVVRGKILREGTPLTYANYHLVKGGRAPKTAPTYFGPSNEVSLSEDSEKGQQYQCEICGWVYNPEIGDPDQGIPPGTPFEKLPDDWVCPLCGAEKNQFKPI